MTSLRHYDDEIEKLKEIINTPYPTDLLSENSTLSLAGVGNSSNRTFVHPIFALENQSNTSNPQINQQHDETLLNQLTDESKVTPNEFLLSLTDPSK